MAEVIPTSQNNDNGSPQEFTDAPARLAKASIQAEAPLNSMSRRSN